jgi:ferredoxin, 2Fe-2S
MKVKFLPQNIEHEINPNESVLELAKRHGIFIKSICGGVPSCSECRVKVVSGEHNIMPPGFKEKNLIGSAYFVDRSRLSCQLKCLGDVTVDLAEQVEKEHAQPASKKPRMPMKRTPNQPRPSSMPRQQFKPPSTEKKDTGSGSGSGEDQS